MESGTTRDVPAALAPTAASELAWGERPARRLRWGRLMALGLNLVLWAALIGLVKLIP